MGVFKINKAKGGKDNTALSLFTSSVYRLKGVIVILPKLYPVNINRGTISCIFQLLGRLKKEHIALRTKL